MRPLRRHHPWRQAIRQLGIFSGLGNRDIDRVVSLSTTITVPAGFMLTRAGQSGQQFFVIAEGSVGVSQDREDVPRPLALLSAGDFFGEMSLLEHVPRNANVTTLSPTTVMVSTPAEFSSLLDIPPVNAKVFAAALDREVDNLLAA